MAMCDFYQKNNEIYTSFIKLNVRFYYYFVQRQFNANRNRPIWGFFLSFVQNTWLSFSLALFTHTNPSIYSKTNSIQKKKKKPVKHSIWQEFEGFFLTFY